MEKLTVEQRRMVIDYYATKLVEEWPAILTGEEIEKRLYESNLKLQWLINKFIPTHLFNSLIEYMLDQQSFDRNEGEWLDENGHDNTAQNRDSFRAYFADIISSHINDIAGI